MAVIFICSNISVNYNANWRKLTKNVAHLYQKSSYLNYLTMLVLQLSAKFQLSPKTMSRTAYPISHTVTFLHLLCNIKSETRILCVLEVYAKQADQLCLDSITLLTHKHYLLPYHSDRSLYGDNSLINLTSSSDWLCD